MWVSVQNFVSNTFSKRGTTASSGADSKTREGTPQDELEESYSARKEVLKTDPQDDGCLRDLGASSKSSQWQHWNTLNKVNTKFWILTQI